MGTSRKWLAALVAGGMVSGVQASDISVSGFMSAGVGWLDDETANNGSGYAKYVSEDATYEADTLVGLQFRGQVSEKMSATVQMVARGYQDYEAVAEWVYVSYDVSDSFTWRAGRLRAPYYQYSDYLDVGYALPWIRAPQEVYFVDSNNVDGFDMLLRNSFGSVDSTIQLYFGAWDGETNGIPVESRNQVGAVWSLTAGSFSGRIAYHSATLTVDVMQNSNIAALYGGLVAMQSLGVDTSSNIKELLVEEDDAEYGNAALNFDNGTLLLGAELALFNIDSSPYGDIKRQSAIIGLRFGDVLLHATLSEAKDDPRTDLDAGIPVFTNPPYPLPAPTLAALNAVGPGLDQVADALLSDQSTITVGLRWDFTSSAALKFQVDDVSYEKTAYKPEAEQTLYSVAIQTVF